MLVKKCIHLFLIVALLFSVSGCRFVDQETREAMKPVTLRYWRVFDDFDAFSEIAQEYQRLHPHINIEYRKLTYEEYEDELLNAFAEDRGPDIYSIHNTWLPRYKSKLLPLPETTTLPYTITRGTIKKEQIVQLRTTPSLTQEQLDQTFVSAVGADVIMKSEPNPDTGEGARDRIYGLPLSVDTMVLYFNKDLFDLGGVVSAPRTWTQFKEVVKTLTRIDSENNVLQSAAGFGLADNVQRYFDILSILMLQNGTVMVDNNGVVTIDSIPTNLDIEVPPAMQALRFYTDYASPIKEVYTWNEDFDDSLTSFINGDTAMFFGYAYHLPLIKAQAPRMKLGISKMPQIANNPEVYSANYWVEVVSEKTENVDEAWDFVQFMAQAEQAEKYLAVTHKPTAHKALINKQLDDIELGTFAEQLLSARSWYTGYDVFAAESVFADMINTVAQNSDVDINQLLRLSAQKLTQTFINPE